MGNFSKDALKTGAKKATRVISLVALTASLALANPTAAMAYVEPQNIIGEEQTVEDRTDIKFHDAEEINDFFIGTDYFGNRFVTREEIAKAIAISDQLNFYNNYEVNQYSNTCKNEVFSLNINDMFDEYLADEGYGFQVFSERNIGQKPAIDAYLNFSCGSIVRDIKTDIENAINNALFNAGLEVTNSPRIRVKGDKVYAFARVNGFVQMIELQGEDLNEALDYLRILDNRYQVCLNNIAGKSNEYPNTFAYNGIDITTGESTWLALGDEELKDTLSSALAYERNVERNLNVTIGDTRFFVWEDEDLEAMRYFGFSEEEISNAIKLDAYLELPRNLVY